MPKPDGARIRATRQEMDLSTAELAARLRISEGSLRNIEGGHDPVSPRVAHRIARELALTFDDVMGNNDGVPDEPPVQPKNQPKAPPKRQDREKTVGPRRANDSGVAA